MTEPLAWDWSALASTAVGGVLALVGSWLASGWQARKEKKAIIEALKSEISSIVLLVQARGLEEYLDKEVNSINNDQEYQPVFKLYGSDPPWEWAIYRDNAGAIGKVGKVLAGDIVRFYTLLRSVQVDIAEVSGRRMTSRSDIKTVLEEDLKIWREQILPAAKRIEAS